jgi:hypothetical protein
MHWQLIDIRQSSRPIPSITAVAETMAAFNSTSLLAAALLLTLCCTAHGRIHGVLLIHLAQAQQCSFETSSLLCQQPLCWGRLLVFSARKA